MSDSQDGGGPVVETEVEAGVGVIRLNRPQSLNAVNTVLVEQLVAAFDSMIDARVDAVVLTGRGRAFCAGHDLKAPTEDPRPCGRAWTASRTSRAGFAAALRR